MKLSDEAQKLKDSIIQEFGIEGPADLAILNAAIGAFNLMREAEELLARDGLTVQGDRGGTKANPAAAVLRDARSGFYAGMKALKLDEVDLWPGGQIGQKRGKL